MRGRRWFVAFAVFVCLGSFAAAGEDDAVADGKFLYRVNCASCHGASAEGDGPAAAALKTQPPDLTRLSKRHGGVFPAEQVRRTIDGRVEFLGHGNREMPIWGLTFQELDADTNQEREVSARIGKLIEYLKSIQKEVGE